MQLDRNRPPADQVLGGMFDPDDPEGPASEHAELQAGGVTRERMALLLALALAWLGVDALACVEALVPADPGECLPWRWARLVAAHPFRSKLGFAAIAWGVIPRPYATPGDRPA